MRKLICNLITKIKLFFKKDKGFYRPVRRFDFEKAEEFMHSYRNDLKEMALCMGFDEFIYTPIIENGELITSPTFLTDVDGVIETHRDVPCIYYELYSGEKGKMYCFKKHDYHTTKKCRRYSCYLGVPYERKNFGIFDENSFEDGISPLRELANIKD